MILYVSLVAALNLGLGFGVAVCLGRRHRAIVSGEGPWSPVTAPEPSRSDVFAGELAESAADGASRSAIDPNAGEPGSMSPPVRPPTELSPREKAVEDFNSKVRQYERQLAQAEENLRASAEDPEAAEVRTILDSLMGSTERYLEKRGEVQGTVEDLCRQQPGLGDGLQTAIEEQDRQIAATSAMIEDFDYENDLAGGCRKMADQTGNLIDSNGQLRETIGEVQVKLAENRQPLHQGDQATQGDTPGEGSEGTDLEAELLKRWNTESDGLAQLSAAIIELDDSAALKQQHGDEVADKVRHAVGQLLAEEGDAESTVFPLAGQRFFLLSSATDPQQVANTVERLRQMIERIRLHHEDAEIRVTVSCAVAGAVPRDTPDALIGRTEATLEEARRYGYNRTFLHDGKYPAPVMPPDFALEQRQVTL